MGKYFDGSFEFLPLRSHLDDGPLPAATSEAFQLAACSAATIDEADGVITWESAARVWRMEAIRERILHGHHANTASHAVMDRVAARLHRAATV
jgi:hypothetical protein